MKASSVSTARRLPGAALFDCMRTQSRSGQGAEGSHDRQASPIPAWRSARAPAQTVSFTRDIERLNGIVDSNALVSARLTATQDALGQIIGGGAGLPVDADHQRRPATPRPR